MHFDFVLIHFGRLFQRIKKCMSLLKGAIVDQIFIKIMEHEGGMMMNPHNMHNLLQSLRTKTDAQSSPSKSKYHLI